jgi:formyltetrahydrofolate deformylase
MVFTALTSRFLGQRHGVLGGAVDGDLQVLDLLLAADRLEQLGRVLQRTRAAGCGPWGWPGSRPARPSSGPRRGAGFQRGLDALLASSVADSDARPCARARGEQQDDGEAAKAKANGVAWRCLAVDGQGPMMPPGRHAATPGCDNCNAMNHSYILTLSCPDRPGIVHAVSGFLLERGGNIEEAAQYNDHGTGLFFMRVQFACGQLTFDDLRAQLKLFGEPFQMDWKLHAKRQPMRTVILVSKEGHCLNDLLFRWKSGLLPVDIRAIVSNHREFYQLAASYNVPFHHIPVTAATKAQAEAQQYEIIESEKADLVVLARYMQILSDDLCRKLSGRAINIHHSFLPSFKGAKPYYQAHDRGVKLIGATAHYVTADLDEGPIIEQDVARVDHAHTVEASPPPAATPRARCWRAP